MKGNEKSALRLDRYLANAGVGTRSEVKKYIKNGQVTVGERTASDPGQKVNLLSDVVYFRGTPVVGRTFSYYLFHKPAGCVTARTDSRERTVMDYFPQDMQSLSPVGRLDFKSRWGRQRSLAGSTPVIFRHLSSLHLPKLNQSLNDQLLSYF